MYFILGEVQIKICNLIVGEITNNTIHVRHIVNIQHNGNKIMLAAVSNYAVWILKEGKPFSCIWIPEPRFFFYEARYIFTHVTHTEE